MKDENEFRAGILSCGEKDYTFALKDFKFIIMDPAKDAVGFSLLKEGKPLFSNESGAICGTTYDNHAIAIYAPDYRCDIDGYRVLHADNYMVRTSNVCPVPEDILLSFNTIEFYGGTLSKVFTPRALSFQSETQEETVLKMSDDSIDFSFSYKGTQCTVSVYSSISRSYSVTSRSIENTDVCLSMHFAAPQSMSDVVTHYHNICQLLSFMVFRKNISFESIRLLNSSDDVPQKRTNEWLFYVKDSGFETRKTPMNCLTFSDIKDCLSGLTQILYSNVDREPGYLLDFIPKEDAELGRFSNDIFKSICSSLECEISFSDIPDSEESKGIKKVGDAVRKFIRKYCKENQPLSQKSRAKISSDIQHWGMATAEQICYLYDHYKDSIKCIPPHTVLSEDDIDAFIKYRNDITHGSYRIGNRKTSTTGYALEALVYCRILSRAGMDDTSIHQLCIHKLMR